MDHARAHAGEAAGSERAHLPTVLLTTPAAEARKGCGSDPDCLAVPLFTAVLVLRLRGSVIGGSRCNGGSLSPQGHRVKREGTGEEIPREETKMLFLIFSLEGKQSKKGRRTVPVMRVGKSDCEAGC